MNALHQRRDNARSRQHAPFDPVRRRIGIELGGSLHAAEGVVAARARF
ncbi:hypothetical protein [Burkholderia glumae]|nr:hypothetical protein [Burkholderia glumae]MCM2536640.1 hypothetical protein [Burkholderia glumae]MCM2549345.1 hypothetical protein [Burkholderia glumae]MCQ0031707.1 hypothetical protein [Burkholderia glumae]MCQ0035272.1 hypothetical protein [Burkholderia glumae]MCR1767777.1 hypothetical protein [Burkholderia glumae]